MVNKGVVIILVIVVLGFLAFQTGALDILIYGVPEDCTINPSQKNCFCDAGEVKVSSFDFELQQITSSCVVAPVLPSSITLPINTWEEAISFAEGYIFPGETLGTVCVGDLGYTNEVTGSVPQEIITQNGLLQIRCTEISGATSGRMLYELVFRPSDSCIFSLTCADTIASGRGLDCIADIEIDPTASTCPLA